MKKITLNIEGKPLPLFVPESWQEVTVQQYVRLESEGWNGWDMVHLLSILSGHPLKELDNIADASVLDILLEHIGFIADNPPDFDRIKINKEIVLDGKALEVPSDLELETLGQKILMSNLMQHDGSMVTQIANAVAIYLQPIFDGSLFDRKRLPYIVKMINKAPIIEVFPLVSFFFRKLKEYKRSGLTF